MTAPTLQTTTPTTSTVGPAIAHALTVNADALGRVLKVTAHGLLKGARGGLPAHRGVLLTMTPGTRAPSP